MSETASRVTDRAAELRAAFDRGFAEPIATDPAVRIDLLAIRVGTAGYAIRLREIAGLLVDKKITRIPGADSALLGLAGFRGVIMPVVNLQSLLDHPTAAAPRWLVIAADGPVALAFDAFERQLRVSPDAILSRPSEGQQPKYAGELVRTPVDVRPLIHLPSVLAAVKAQKSRTIRLEES